MMIKLNIDGKELIAGSGMSILQAAQAAGIEIPSMCSVNEPGHSASCMVCLVKDSTSGRLIPSCSVRVSDGMKIITNDEEVIEARKMALELLLSDHTGDCEAPCHTSCPAHMNIPEMNRLLAVGKISEALSLIRKDIVLPSVLGRICPAPCEGACRRKTIDDPVNICLLKRYAGDHGEWMPSVNELLPGDKKVAVIGAGPAGLAAAFYIRQKGFQSVVFDKNDQPGGALMYAVSDEKLDKGILQKEIEDIKKSGVEFRQHSEIDTQKFRQLCLEYQAVVIATGDFVPELAEWGLNHEENRILAEKKTYRTNTAGVFAIGNVNRSSRLAIRSLAQGKEVAFSVTQYLKGQPVTGEPEKFNSHFGKLVQEEFAEYLKESLNADQHNAAKDKKRGLSAEEIQKEAGRCMHCDCRKLTDCRLRDYSGLYDARQKRFTGEERKPVRKNVQHELLVYEPEKCIKCGICVTLTAKYGEEFGVTYIGRGFDVEIGIPFNEGLDAGLKKTATLIAEACPTGALALK